MSVTMSYLTCQLENISRRILIYMNKTGYITKSEHESCDCRHIRSNSHSKLRIYKIACKDAESNEKSLYTYATNALQAVKSKAYSFGESQVIKCLDIIKE